MTITTLFTLVTFLLTAFVIGWIASAFTKAQRATAVFEAAAIVTLVIWVIVTIRTVINIFFFFT